MVNPVREVEGCNTQSTRESLLNDYWQFQKSAPQHEIIPRTAVINRICQNEDIMDKNKAATATSQQHVVHRVMIGEWTVSPMRVSLESQEPYCHGWRGQPGGRGLWGEVWTCARVNQSGVRHWQAHTFTLGVLIQSDQLGQTYLPTVMWKFPATLLTNRYPCILQAFSEVEPSSLRPEEAGEEGQWKVIRRKNFRIEVIISHQPEIWKWLQYRKFCFNRRNL